MLAWWGAAAAAAPPTRAARLIPWVVLVWFSACCGAGLCTPSAFLCTPGHLTCRCVHELEVAPASPRALRSPAALQLNRLQTPDYVHELTVVSVDLGCTVPTLCNLVALPLPGELVWPQLLFDVRYEGEFSILLETKVDIRDAAAWGKLDKALTRMEGRQPTAAAAGGGAEEAEAAGEDGEGGLLPGGSPAESEDEQQTTPQPSPGWRGAPAGDQQQQQNPGEPSSPPSGGRAGPRHRPFMEGLRQTAAKRLRQLAETTATHIKRTPLRLRLTFSLLEGTMAVFVPPPPGNRMFYTFVLPPRVSVVAKPEVGGRGGRSHSAGGGMSADTGMQRQPLLLPGQLGPAVRICKSQ